MEYENGSVLDKNTTSNENSSIQVSNIFEIDLENWMGNLPEELTNIPLIHLAIPGSHNSFTYTLSSNSEVSPDSPAFVQSLGRWCKPITNRLIFKWSQNQKKDVVQQLEIGVRFFDLRLVVKDDDIHTSHGLYGGVVQDFLEGMRTFLDGHPKEVVIVDFQHFYEFYPVHHDRMVSMMLHIFGNKICRRERRMRENTLKVLWHDKSQVIVIYRNPITRFNELFWPSGTWETPWPNKIKIPDLLDYLNNGLNNRKDGMGYVSQGILTPTPKYIFLHFFGSLKGVANRANKKIISWLESKNIGANGVNVVLCDFIERHNFCEKVILLNYKNLSHQSPTPLVQKVMGPSFFPYREEPRLERQQFLRQQQEQQQQEQEQQIQIKPQPQIQMLSHSQQQSPLQLQSQSRAQSQLHLQPLSQQLSSPSLQSQSSLQLQSHSQSQSPLQLQSPSQQQSPLQPQSPSQQQSPLQLQSPSQPQSLLQFQSPSQSQSSVQLELQSQPQSSLQMQSQSQPQSSLQLQSRSQPQSSLKLQSRSQPQSQSHLDEEIIDE